MAATLLTGDMTVAQILDQWPEAVAVFQEFKTACVGCSMAPFDTMVDVAREYGLELPQIMAALERIVQESGETGGTNA